MVDIISLKTLKKPLALACDASSVLCNKEGRKESKHDVWGWANGTPPYTGRVLTIGAVQ